MGHERINILPRTRPWRAIVSKISKFDQENNNISEIIKGTLNNVRDRFEYIYDDTGINSVFKFLVIFSISSKYDKKKDFLFSFGIKTTDKPSPLEIAKELKKWSIKETQSNEYSEIAQTAAIDSLASWYAQNKSNQIDLFQSFNDPYKVWQNLGTGAGFCEIARQFFSNFTERYMKYFLEREASSVFNEISLRNQFNHQLEKNINDISKHAFETAKITQSFAAGWFNKYTKKGIPKEQEIKSFLRLSFEKLREELLRESIS